MELINILNKKQKNTINRHRMEMVRLMNLVKRGYMTKQEAIHEFSDYLEYNYGRTVFREYPYKKSA